MLQGAVNIEALRVLDALRRTTDARRALTSILLPGLSEIDALSTEYPVEVYFGTKVEDISDSLLRETHITCTYLGKS